jgi:hypothetical protein
MYNITINSYLFRFVNYVEHKNVKFYKFVKLLRYIFRGLGTSSVVRPWTEASFLLLNCELDSLIVKEFSKFTISKNMR